MPAGIACGRTSAAFIQRNPIPRILRIGIPAIAIISRRNIDNEIVSWQYRRAKIRVRAITCVYHCHINRGAALGNSPRIRQISATQVGTRRRKIMPLQRSVVRVGRRYCGRIHNAIRLCKFHATVVTHQTFRNDPRLGQRNRLIQFDYMCAVRHGAKNRHGHIGCSRQAAGIESLQ